MPIESPRYLLLLLLLLLLRGAVSSTNQLAGFWPRELAKKLDDSDGSSLALFPFCMRHTTTNAAAASTSTCARFAFACIAASWRTKATSGSPLRGVALRVSDTKTRALVCLLFAAGFVCRLSLEVLTLMHTHKQTNKHSSCYAATQSADIEAQLARKSLDIFGASDCARVITAMLLFCGAIELA